MIETDVRRTPGGELVLHHDPLPAAPHADLCTLHDLVAAARGRVALDIELKEPGFEEDALSALTPRPEGLWLTSFLPGVLEAIAALDPAVPTGLLIDAGDVAGDAPARARACGARILAPHASLFDDRLRGAAMDAGLGLIVWTVNDRERLGELLADPAVDCVITDDVPLAVTLRDRFRPQFG